MARAIAAAAAHSTSLLTSAAAPTTHFRRRSLRLFRVHVSNSPTMSHHHPSIEVIGDLLVPQLKTLKRPYNPYPLIGWNCHVETIFAAWYRTLPEVRFKRQCLRSKDGGSLALDWVAGDVARLPVDSPVLILLPGLTGGSEDSYVRHMLLRARSMGWRVVVFNSRGCGDSPVTTSQFYSASYTEDIREVVRHVASRYPEARLYAAGWSIGANILVHYLSQESETCLLSGAVSLCNPFDLVIADEDFHKGFNNVYDRALASSLCKIFKKHAPLFEDMGGEFNIPLAASAKTVREFDDGITRVSFGFKSVDDYYSYSSSSKVIKNVRIPLLCIQAANDPIAPSRGIPYEDIKGNRNCLLIVTPKGGHLGWVAGEEAPRGAPWTDPLVMDFLQNLESNARLHTSTSCSSRPDESVHQSTDRMDHLKV